MPPPLQGLRVLDLTRVLAGPTATMLLGDLGADVVKVEHTTRGDDTRQFPPTIHPTSLSLPLIFPRTGSWLPPAAPVVADRPPETSHLPAEFAYFLAVNRNKRSIAVDFKRPDGRAIVDRLVRTYSSRTLFPGNSRLWVWDTRIVGG
jgi:succinate--hydroxymethylglutarate CoA-transferase